MPSLHLFFGSKGLRVPLKSSGLLTLVCGIGAKLHTSISNRKPLALNGNSSNDIHCVAYSVFDSADLAQQKNGVMFMYLKLFTDCMSVDLQTSRDEICIYVQHYALQIRQESLLHR